MLGICRVLWSGCKAIFEGELAFVIQAEKLSSALGDGKDGFHVTVHPNMAMVVGRVLPAPRILYGGRTRQVRGLLGSSIATSVDIQAKFHLS